MAAPSAPAHVAPGYVTLDAFSKMYYLPKLTELVDGEVVTQPFPSADHGYLVRALFKAMDAHAVAHGLGEVFGDGFGYVLSVPGRPDTYRVPDVSFIRAERVPRRRRLGWALEIAPDVAVEVRSPSDKPGVLRRKLVDYREAGVALVWVVDARTRSAEVHALGAPARVLGEEDVLDGGALLPGFTFPLARLFAVLDGWEDEPPDAERDA